MMYNDGLSFLANDLPFEPLSEERRIDLIRFIIRVHLDRTVFGGDDPKIDLARDISVTREEVVFHAARAARLYNQGPGAFNRELFMHVVREAVDLYMAKKLGPLV